MKEHECSVVHLRHEGEYTYVDPCPNPGRFMVEDEDFGTLWVCAEHYDKQMEKR